MPRASWQGFLRLSLVSCPIYLSPATTRTKPIRLHQVWQPAPVDVDEDDLPDRGGGRRGSAPSVPRLPADNASADGDQSPAATRITLRPHDPGTGEEIEKREVVKGYEYSRGQFLTFTDEELKALDTVPVSVLAGARTRGSPADYRPGRTRASAPRSSPQRPSRGFRRCRAAGRRAPWRGPQSSHRPRPPAPATSSPIP